MENRKYFRGKITVQLHWQQSTFGEPFFGAHRPLRRLLNLAILAALHPAPLLANPNGAHIINGQVSIDTATPGVTTITNSPNAIIQWQNFNIAQNETTRFVQQNSQSAVLNRIIGENPSTILGQLASNGKVFLINPNGVVFGANSVVDTQGLIASSLNLSNQDFLTGNYHFIAGSGTEPGAIVNEGIIRAGKNGNIILIAPSIQNNGIIKSDGGQITLAAGKELLLTSLDNPDIRYAVQAPDNAVLNLGKLLTEGGAVNVFAGTITHSGDINADSVTVDAQGHIQLIAQNDVNLTQGSKLSANNSQGDAGTIQIDSKTGTTTLHGTLEAKATQTGKGGEIALLGEQVGVLDNARINANGNQGGGQVLIGGDKQGGNPAIHNAKATTIGADSQITADAKSNGNGGKVIAWSEQATRAYGQISAQGGKRGGDGGFVETSGRWLDTSDIKVNASAAHGNNGEWLLDPNDITIQATGNDTHVDGNPNWTANNDSAILTTGSLQSALNNGTSVTVTTSTAGDNSQAGNITVASAIAKTAGGDAKLSLNAHNDIAINAPITASAGKLDLTLQPDIDNSGSGSTTINRPVDLNAGTLTLPGNSTVSSTLKNAAVTIPSAANSQLNGLLDTTKTITIDPTGSLTINRANANFNGSFDNRGTLTVNAYFVMKALKLDGGVLTGSGAVTVNDEFEFESGNLAGTGRFTTATGSLTTLAHSGTAYLDKNWDNFGTINWQGVAGLISHSDSNTVLNNFAGGTLNINNKNPASNFEINTARFNNTGTLHLSGGTLKIASTGIDTGRYSVTGNGQLQFWDGNRTFSDGASIHSANALKFVNGENYFTNGSHYSAPETFIDNATVSFNTGTTITLPLLTIDSGTVRGPDSIVVSTALNFYSGLFTGGGSLTTPAGATTLLTEGQALLNRNWDNFGTVNYGIGQLSAPANAAQLAASPAFPAKQWNNYGIINWQGQSAHPTQLGNNIVLTNKPGSVFNISNQEPLGIRELNLGVFNNQGTLNLSSGILRISSKGNDTGFYNITNTGQLQFWTGSRIFNSGTNITSANPVSFVNGTNRFNNETTFSTPKTIIDGAAVSFTAATTLNDLVMSGGTLHNANNLNIQGNFDWSGGTVAGKGDFQFTNGFSYTAGTLLATGALDINDTSATLRLPAMPSITRLTAHTTGDLLLTGDITANSKGDALILTTDNRFNNSIGATLSTPNGRWLVFSDSPVNNSLGGLTANFKHYGCAYNMACNDAFNVSASVGNGLLYHIIPVLSVTPNKLTSVYGNPANFTSTLTGFIDGDGPASGITGNASYTVNGNLSDAGYHNVGKHNVAYSGGLASTLGYRIQDNTASAKEWAITPRALNIKANPASKFDDEPDPLFTYNTTGLMPGDKLTGSLSRVAGKDVGSYPILRGSLAATTNYRVNYKGANLKIKEEKETETETDADDTVREGIDDEQNSVVVLAHQAGLKEEYEADEHQEGHEHHEEASEKKTKRQTLKQCK
ncbi:MAG: filamentous hemagglutinin N-terminal domain-containing protein [Methylovulum sp.]|nr:filamentous hemagglutinin N-terminal domain-containing protein [Methylovulum sp.]